MQLSILKRILRYSCVHDHGDAMNMINRDFTSSKVSQPDAMLSGHDVCMKPFRADLLGQRDERCQRNTTFLYESSKYEDYHASTPRINETLK